MSSKIVEQSRSGLLGIGKKMLANERSARCSYLRFLPVILACVIGAGQCQVNADPDIPVLKQAKAEYAKFQ